MDDEIAFHIESRVSELIGARAVRGDGARATPKPSSATCARRAASSRPWTGTGAGVSACALWLEATAHDLRHAARSLRRVAGVHDRRRADARHRHRVERRRSSPSSTACCSVRFRSEIPSGSSSHRTTCRRSALLHEPQTGSTYFAYQRLAHTIEGIGVYREGEVNVAEPGRRRRAGANDQRQISATLIPVLQVSPLIGRTFTDADDRPGAAPVMLISEGMWRARFGGDRKILGRRLERERRQSRNRRRHAGAFPLSRGGDAAVDSAPTRSRQSAANGYAYFGTVARLKPGVTVADAERDFAAVLPRAAELFPNFVTGISTRPMLDQMHPKPSLRAAPQDITGAIAGTLWMVAAAALLVLLVACANVANLTLVRADARQREIAVREALGAGRGRVMLHFFAESAVVTALAAVLGFAAAAAAVRSLVAPAPPGFRDWPK